MFLKLFLSFFFALVNSCNSDPFVRTKFGEVQGLTGTHGNLKYEAFLGIPFAEPPLGNLRFQMPVPFHPNWSTPYQALNFGHGCIQIPSPYFDFNTSEDCLYLNIWRPKMNGNNSELLPVFYLLHGSGYIIKSGALPPNHGDVLAATQNIIVVNSNYRLGAFGFAYGANASMPGNLGIYDALAVLRWIRDNIQSFGGDPSRVTLAGQSAGGCMATIIATLPHEFESQQLFSRLVMMSGVTVNYMLVDDPALSLSKTRLMASKVNCSSNCNQSGSSMELSSEIIDCLKKVDASDILKAQNDPDVIALGNNDIGAFIPVYGTELMPEVPMMNHAHRIESIKDKPMIFGVEQDEFTRFKSVANINTLSDAYEFFKKRISITLKDIQKDKIDFFYNLYFSNQLDSVDAHEIKKTYVKIFSDMWFHCPSLILSEFFSQKNSDIYFYRNGYVGENLAKNSGRLYGSVHADDILFGLGDPIREHESYTENDREFSRFFLNLLGNFTKGFNYTDWPSIRLKNKDYDSLQVIKLLNLSSSNIEDQDQQICNKWAQLYNYSIPQFPILVD